LWHRPAPSSNFVGKLFLPGGPGILIRQSY